MLVSIEDFDGAIAELIICDKLSLDTETTGLDSYKDASLFSVIISTDNMNFYFNFNQYDGLNNRHVLPREYLLRFNELKGKTIFLANAKFDMHFLEKEGVSLKGNKIWDVLTVAKCLHNTHMSYSLDNVAKRAGYEKLKTVEEYIVHNKLYTKSESGARIPRYDMVPIDIISEYGIRDAEITFSIGMEQMEEVRAMDDFATKGGFPSFVSLIEKEMKVTEVCYEMERTGMEIDREFISRALEHEQARAVQAAKQYAEITGTDFVDSNKSLSESFTKLGLSGGTTEKGNPSFTDEVLKNISHPIAKEIKEYRDATKRANTYYKNFLSYSDKDGIVHPNIKQAGADTFRFSITAPALQTLSASEQGEYLVRDAFKAREGFTFVSVDFSQQEYRLTADYAGEHALIKQIKDGTDVHTATAQLMGVDRTQAKTLNFMLLYGGGVAKLCGALFSPKLGESGLRALTWKYIYKSLPKEPALAKQVQEDLCKITQEEINHDLPLLQKAFDLREKYFSSLPKTKQFIDAVMGRAKDKGYVYNWAGRRLNFPDPRFAYKAPNHLIQSSGAEIMRGSMVGIHDFLLKTHVKSKMLLSIHDELLLEMLPSEFDLIPKIREIMKNVYKPFNGLMMDTSVCYGKTWGKLEDGIPDGTKERDSIS